MRAHRFTIAISLLLGLAGCPTRPRHDEAPTLRIVSPALGSYVSGTVMVKVDVTGTPGIPVTLYVDGARHETLSPPAYSLAWNTAAVSEGIHTLTAALEYPDDPAPIRSSAVTITVDRTPPTVVSTTPAPNATNVALRAPITVAFSEPILGSSITPAAISLMGAEPVAKALTLSADQKALTITVDDPTTVTLGVALTLTLTSAITDRAGNGLRDPVQWSWTVPEWIKLPGESSHYAPAAALGPDQLPVVVYAAPTTMGLNTVVAARYDGQAWVYLPPVSPTGRPAEDGYDVAVDSKGKIVACWSDFSGDPSKHLQFRSWDGTAWSSPFPVLEAQPGQSTSAIRPSLRFDRNDNLAVAWIEGGDVHFARWTGSSWDKSRGSLGLSGVQAVELVLDPRDNPVIGWSLQPTFDVGISTWDGGWSTGRMHLGNSHPAIATNAAGVPIMPMVEGPQITIYRLANGMWSPEVAESLRLTTADQNPDLAVDGDRGPVVAWMRMREGGLRLARWNRDRWDQRAPTFSAGGQVVESTWPRVLVDRNGTVWIAWLENGLVNVWMSNY